MYSRNILLCPFNLDMSEPVQAIRQSPRDFLAYHEDYFPWQGAGVSIKRRRFMLPA